jgi:hypothetical protein
LADTNENSGFRGDPRVLAAAHALREHFAAEDEMVNSFPSDEYICCAEVALKAAGVELAAEEH